MDSRTKLFNQPVPGHAFGAFINKALVIALCVGWAFGCSKSTAPALTIDSIPFAERNGKEEFNASGIVPLADSRFLICDNNTNDALFELNLGPDGQKNGPLIRRPLQGLAPGAIDDLEGITLAEENGRRYVFVSSSLYAKKGKKGAVDVPPSGILRVTINPDDTLSAENMPGFREWLIGAYPQIAASAQTKPDDGGLNIEGFTWDKRRHAFLFGVRTPVSYGKPFVLPVKVKDLAGAWTPDSLEAQPPIQLSVDAALDEQGIRDLYNDQDHETVLVITGKSNSDSKAPFALYEWSGGPDGAMRRFNIGFAKKMKPEGIARGVIGGKSAIVIVDDGGGYQVVWADQQLPFVGAS
ncbi:MAG TPA: hypothetical protein VFS27_06620 [Blastocatellia bacterium]|jgi:hypothetical protein|nr:hypothetical protein [Blastocatellia bacterium]